MLFAGPAPTTTGRRARRGGVGACRWSDVVGGAAAQEGPLVQGPRTKRGSGGRGRARGRGRGSVIGHAEAAAASSTAAVSPTHPNPGQSGAVPTPPGGAGGFVWHVEHLAPRGAVRQNVAPTEEQVETPRAGVGLVVHVDEAAQGWVRVAQVTAAVGEDEAAGVGNGPHVAGGDGVVHGFPGSDEAADGDVPERNASEGRGNDEFKIEVRWTSHNATHVLSAIIQHMAHDVILNTEHRT